MISCETFQAFSETSGIITMFYVVRGLSPYTEYEFHVIGVNNIGRGPASSPVSVITGETGELFGIVTGFPISELVFHR